MPASSPAKSPEKKSPFSTEKQKKSLQHSLSQLQQVADFVNQPSSQEFLLQAATCLASALKQGNKILIAGNGGSLCDAAHFAEELTGQFRRYRPALPAIALSDPSHLTCVANDMGFDKVFSRGVEALGKKGDVFIGLSTSGNSENIYQAFLQAQKQGLQTLAFLGKEGGKTRGLASIEWIIEGFSTSDRIQEAHMAAMHIIIELIEDQLFYAVS